MRRMKKVKPGDAVIINGVKYRIGESSARAINACIDLLEAHHMAMGAVNERGATIDLYNADGQGGKSFPPSKILEALKRAEQNKTPQ